MTSPDPSEVQRSVRVRWRITGDSPESGELIVGRGAAEAGTAEIETVEIETDDVTAAELRAGVLSAQHALLLGRLRLGGDPDALRAAATTIADGDDSTDAGA